MQVKLIFNDQLSRIFDAANGNYLGVFLSGAPIIFGTLT